MKTFSESSRAACAGDPAAFGELLLHFGRELERYVARAMSARARRRVAPEDVCQETLLALIERLATYPAELTERELRAGADAGAGGGEERVLVRESH